MGIYKKINRFAVDLSFVSDIQNTLFRGIKNAEDGT